MPSFPEPAIVLSPHDGLTFSGGVDLKKGRLLYETLKAENFFQSVSEEEGQGRSDGKQVKDFMHFVDLKVEVSDDEGCGCCLGARRGPQLTTSQGMGARPTATMN